MATLVGVKWCLTVVLVCVSLMPFSSDGEHLFACVCMSAGRFTFCLLSAVPWVLSSPSCSAGSCSQWILAMRAQIMQVGLWVWAGAVHPALLCLTLSDLHPLFRKTQISSSHPNLWSFNTMKNSVEPVRNNGTLPSPWLPFGVEGY